MNYKNDISPKNSQASSGNTFSGNSAFYGPNNISPQKTYNTDNAANTNAAKSAKKAASISSTLKTFAVMFSAVLMGTAGLGLMPTTSITATFGEIWAYEGYVSYSVELSEYEDGLVVVLYDDFTHREEQIIEEYMEEENTFWGSFEGLVPNLTYTIAVKKGSTIIAKQSVFVKEHYDKDFYDEPNSADDDGRDPKDDNNGTYDPNNPSGEDYGNNDNPTYGNG